MAKLKVLAVDDDKINMKLLEMLLKKNENVKEYITAENGRDAFDKLNKNKDINLILLDIQMPIMNGIEFLEEKNTRQELEEVPVIILTTDETKKTESIEKGAFDFLMKPIKKEILNEKLEMIESITD